MLVEKFDFLEVLRLAIAQSEGKGKITKSIVLGEMALLSPGAKMWAEILVERVDFERIAIITPAEEQTELFISKYDFNYQVERRIEDKPGKVEFKTGEIKSALFFKVRNKLAKVIHKEMVKKNFKPNNPQGSLENVAKAMAEVVLRGHLFVKAMCPPCQGLGKLEIFDGHKNPIGTKFCEKCEGSGKRPYTLKEKIDIAHLTITKTAYIKSYQKYEQLGESIVAEWENEIRARLAKSFHFDEHSISEGKMKEHQIGWEYINFPVVT
ncbi:hypothetical protein BJD20_12895 [Acinetobacter proteolyticus]|uniref:hypothetical protein n=1 Tax=Acinetobacter proteolyticus TaxID=1776741 RepID=UPI0008631CC2|nr:hypothetical protein [Acinetobacter proteolyticus]OEY96000.1 hypothetical protein BJD20_12895 [Acinetobacter proteolyticus]